MDFLTENWVSDAFYDEVGLNREDCKRYAVFLAYVHDIGKATPAFQRKILKSLPDFAVQAVEAGFSMKPLADDDFKHAHGGAQLLRVMGCPESTAAIVGAHHGKPEANDESVCDPEEDLSFHAKYYGAKSPAWKKLQKDILSRALRLAGYQEVEDIPDQPDTAQLMFSGLLIMADWISSNEEYFPLLPVDEAGIQYDRSRVKKAMQALELPSPLEVADCWKEDAFFSTRFGFADGNNVQKATMLAAEHAAEPGLMILEAPMGMGKTESALAAAEVLMNRFLLGGIAFFLPSQATTNAMFDRILLWLGKMPGMGRVSLQLMHSNANLNDSFAKLRDGRINLADDVEREDHILVHTFFRGRKTKLLSTVVVGTVDQLLMASLRQKHVMLRHLGLSGKVVVIDECHAYDAYMNIYLDSTLRWLGQYHIPVVLLSATLPGKRRAELVKAYTGRKYDPDLAASNAYPLLTWSDGGSIHMDPIPCEKRQTVLTIQKEADGDILSAVKEVLACGGCAGIILNTVKSVQETADSIRQAFPNAEILIDHSQYLLPDRLAHEEEIKNRIGKHSTPESRRNVIVIGSQVLEQSLDIDFDLLITDLCPMDLLLQRIGRLHRHKRTRPAELKQARCIVLHACDQEPEAGAKAIYGEYLLRRTSALLPDTIVLPQDISVLVQQVYNEEEGQKQFPEAFAQYELNEKNKQNKADIFCLPLPMGDDESTIVGLLDNNPGFNDAQAQATVRDGTSSIEIIALKDNGDRTALILSGEKKGSLVRMDTCPSWEEAVEIAKQRLRLPARFSKVWCAEKNMSELEKRGKESVPEWMDHPMLKGELIVILDEDSSFTLDGIRLYYHEERGLTLEVKNHE